MHWRKICPLARWGQTKNIKWKIAATHCRLVPFHGRRFIKASLMMAEFHLTSVLETMDFIKESFFFFLISKGQWGIKTYPEALPSVSSEIPLRDSGGGDRTGEKTNTCTHFSVQNRHPSNKVTICPRKSEYVGLKVSKVQSYVCVGLCSG